MPLLPYPPFPRSSTFTTAPETHYVQNGDVNIAYQIIGEGDLDIVFVMGWVSHLEYFWKEPHFAAFLNRLASFSRLILFDKRGTGLSDRVPLSELPTLEQRMEDVHAVMDAVGSERAVFDRRFGRRTDVRSVCGDLSRKNDRAGDDRNLRQTDQGRRLSVGRVCRKTAKHFLK